MDRFLVGSFSALQSLSAALLECAVSIIIIIILNKEIQEKEII